MLVRGKGLKRATKCLMHSQNIDKNNLNCLFHTLLNIKSHIEPFDGINKKYSFFSIGLTPPNQVPIDLHVKFCNFDNPFL